MVNMPTLPVAGASCPEISAHLTTDPTVAPAWPRSAYVAEVAYDEALADRVRDSLAAEPDLTERKMFGGLAFMLGGHLTIAVSGEGGVMARVGADVAERSIDRDEAEPVVMRGRPMTGYVRVDPDQLRTEPQLATWVGAARAFVRALPSKPGEETS